MSYLLDTNVVSESMRPRPNRAVTSWLAETDEDHIFLSTISIAEIRRGIALMGAGKRRDLLDRWLAEDLPERFEGRLLDVDIDVANAWGEMMGEGRRRGIALSVLDGFLAATARVHALTLVTRDAGGFAGCGVALLNPWEPE